MIKIKMSQGDLLNFFKKHKLKEQDLLFLCIMSLKLIKSNFLILNYKFKKMKKKLNLIKIRRENLIMKKLLNQTNSLISLMMPQNTLKNYYLHLKNTMRPLKMALFLNVFFNLPNNYKTLSLVIWNGRV